MLHSVKKACRKATQKGIQGHVRFFKKRKVNRGCSGVNGFKPV